MKTSDSSEVFCFADKPQVGEAANPGANASNHWPCPVRIQDQHGNDYWRDRPTTPRLPRLPIPSQSWKSGSVESKITRCQFGSDSNAGPQVG